MEGCSFLVFLSYRCLVIIFLGNKVSWVLLVVEKVSFVIRELGIERVVEDLIDNYYGLLNVL